MLTEQNFCSFNIKLLSKLILINLALISHSIRIIKKKILIFFSNINKENIKISVILPTFNRGNLIEKSIKSVLNQTFNNIEILIIDDGSNDNTKDIIKNIDDKRIKYIKLVKNKGACNARNVGIKKARGEYITFQDSDDILYPFKLEKQLKNLINNNSSLDFCKIRIFENDSYYYTIPKNLTEQRLINGSIFEVLISYGNFISTQAILSKKDILLNYMFDPLFPRLQDYDLILRMAPNIKISYTREVLVDIHIQNNSITRSKDKLKHTIFRLLTKQYNLNKEQKTSFYNYLLKLLNGIMLHE